MKKEKQNSITRRDILKAIIGVPFLGYFANRFYVRHRNDINTSGKSRPDLDITQDSSGLIPAAGYSSDGGKIRIGVVGNGMRGPAIYRALGFASEGWVNGLRDSSGGVLDEFLIQDDLNVEITGVCDTFSDRAEAASKVVASPFRAGGAVQARKPEIYPTYRDMLKDDNLDAMVILTPDHWHAKMAMDAARAGKHVYLEKPMCQTAGEAKSLRDLVKETGIILQVGHQNRQQASFFKAREIISKDILGPISLIETFTNRNNDSGAWIRGIPGSANESNTNWKEFLGDKPWRDFDPDRYFNWQKWFEYGTGPAGNQFTHEYDCINQIMDLGIPAQVIATGGNYYYRDPRDIPDVFNAVFEYPDKGLALTYDCTLRNSMRRNKTIFGRDATMDLSGGIAIYPDNESDRYTHYGLESGQPIFTFNPRTDMIDAHTSATARYYFDKGFGSTYINKKRVDCTYLHMKEWLYCIRNRIQPSCNVDRGFEETVTFYMANRAYLENRVVQWNDKKETII